MKGMPLLFESAGTLRNKVEEDFPDYSYSEQRALIKALAVAKKVERRRIF